ncbi:MAG TPA: glycosyltransferase, partial [Chloroflexota bacterium]|nr:glycosyltransferase [Chloroflexota bacterium]
MAGRQGQPLSTSDSLTVAFCAELPPDGRFGGVEQNILGLLHALGEFDAGDRFIVTTLPSAPAWPAAVLGENMRLRPIQAGWQERFMHQVRSRLAPGSKLRRAVRGSKRAFKPYAVPDGRARYARLNADLVHFPFQWFARTGLPSVYCPHDLQHVHLPELFDEVVIADRELLYGAGCREATAVVVESEWVRQDIVSHFGVSRDRIFIIPTSAPTSAYDGITP